MAKYDGLTLRLAGETTDRVTLSFGELDSLVGGLPPSAREHRPWWGNARNSAGQAKSWLDAGWLVDGVDLLGAKVTFVRSADIASGSVRQSVLMRGLFEVLAEAGSPLKPSDALAAVRDHVGLTDVEQSLNNSGLPRYETFLRFVSSWSNKVGWMSKVKGWAITQEGRRVLAELDEDRLYPELTRLYRAALAQQRESTSLASDPKSAVLKQVLSVIDAGEWSTYAEVGELAGLSPQAVGKFVNTIPTEQGHRVLLADYRCGEDFQWAEFREESQRDVLESEGVEFGWDGTADLRSHVGVEDLRDRLETAGILQTPTQRAWLVRGSSVQGRDLVPDWLLRDTVSLAASKLRPVEPGISRDDLKPIVDEDYAHTSYAAKAEKLDEFHGFLTRMQPGHLVATTSQGRLFLGQIVGEATYVQSEDGRSNLRREVAWAEPIEGVDYADLPGDVSGRLQVQRDVLDLTQQLETLQALIEGTPESSDEPVVIEELVLRDATDELAAELHVSRTWLQQCIELLTDRPQLIFYGPPGTGKTYIAQAIGRHIAEDNVRLVQFHPAYSYEDFFEGYRPVPSGGFELRPGPMRKIVDQALDNPTVPHVLIIDEINRGNLAKVFGELYFLLEYRDKNVDLLYASDDDKGFTLPRNVYIIGTMNTADRSIALVDAAMRRRFAFLSLHPSEPPTNGVLRSWLDEESHPTRVADLLDELNARIEDADFKVGPSYFMRPAVYQPGGLDRTWNTSILPLLEEHHYGELTAAEVASRYGLAAIAARVDRVSAVEPDQEYGDAPPDAD
jgi:5-methylcytosine-specific restriction protein B